VHRKAIRHLKTCDPVMAGIIERIGPYRMQPSTHLSPFEAVARSIVYQQLSNKAAATIYGRVESLFSGSPPEASRLLTLTDAQLRAAGLSKQKSAYLRDLATRVAGGEVPIDSLHDLEDGDVIAHLTRVKGIGRWTAQMFLMFRLGRPDVLPELDLGVQKAVQRAYRLRKLPTPERLLKMGAKWAPYRSVATWYLWRSIDDAT
jgi:3-methyladenine DNA glycosylase/8-oxoguanine DNA glycosylase